MKSIFFSALMFIFFSARCQNYVDGRVVDELGYPLPGVNILVKGTVNGTTTDVDGKFSLSGLDQSSTLIISFVGYITQKHTVSGRGFVEIMLEPDISRNVISLFNQPRLFRDKFPELIYRVNQMTANIKANFADRSHFDGKAILIDDSDLMLKFAAPTDLLFSPYDEKISSIDISYRGYLYASRELTHLDITSHSNRDVSIIIVDKVSAQGNRTELCFSDKVTKSYFLLTDDVITRLKLVKADPVYHELHFLNSSMKVPEIGTPVFNKYGVVGLIVDNVGSNLIATQLDSTVLSLFPDSLARSKFNSQRFSKRFVWKNLLPHGLTLGFAFANGFFKGSDLRANQSAFSPSVQLIAKTNLLGFRIGLDFTYGELTSKSIESSPTFTLTRNRRYGPAFSLGRSILSFNGVQLTGFFKYSILRSTTELVNIFEQTVPIQSVIPEAADRDFKALSFGSSIDFDAILISRSSLASRSALSLQFEYFNSDSRFVDVLVQSPSSSAVKKDKFMTVGLSVSVRIF